MARDGRAAYAKDIEEVDGTIEEVILYKSKDARSQNHIPTGTSIVVEDTIIRNLDTGKDITDIKWNVNALEEGTNVEWITSLGLNDGINIYIFQGKERGIITRQRGDDGFAFDPYFIPTKLYQEYTKDYTLNGVNYGKLYPNHTLGELDKIGVKDLFSARMTALKNLSEFRLDRVVSLVDIPEWEGRYQNEKEINVNFVKIIDKSNIGVKTYERGCGYTLACGTGMTSSAYIANKLGLVNDKVKVSSPGGEVEIEILKEKLYMTGPAQRICDGRVDDNWLLA